MGDDRYARDEDQRRDTFGRRDMPGRDSWDRDGQDRDRQDRDRDSGYRGYGSQRDDDGYRSSEYGIQRYGQREQMNRGIDYGRAGSSYGQSQGGGRESFGGGRDYYGGDRSYGRSAGYGESGNYGRDDHDYGQRNDGRSDFGRDGYGERHPNDRGASQNSYGQNYGQGNNGDRSRYGSDAQGSGRRDYGRQPQGYQYEERGFLARAGDEVRSWFGDDEAERRRDQDARMDERYDNDSDSDYGSWRRGQIDALDRDYHEYRQENRTRFQNEFSSWRTNRQGQRDSLDKVKEHAEVVGSDGSHVGTVDKVRGDRIILTKTDRDAGGHHHSIPSSWLSKVEDDKVMLSKTADEAKKAWRDEENRSAFGSQDRSSRSGYGQSSGTGMSGTGMSGTGSSSATSGASGSSSMTGTTGSTASTGASTSSTSTDGSDKTGLDKSFSGTY